MHAIWKEVAGKENTFTRPLGILETGFAWESLCRGGADFTSSFIVETDDTLSSRFFAEENVRNAWLGLKRIYPLIAANVSPREDGSGFDFVVSEEKVLKFNSNEIICMTARSDEEVAQMAESSLNEDPSLSNNLLVQLWLISVPRNKNSEKEEPYSVAWHVMLQVRHFVVDGTASTHHCRVFMEILLAGGKIPDKLMPQGALLDRLNLHLPIEEVNPARKSSMARIRWRRATAAIIARKRNQTFTGGVILPRRNTVHTPETPLRSIALYRTFTKDITHKILNTCRQQGVSVGIVMFLLSQIAHARVHHRLYAQGLTSDADWERLKIEPMHFLGPMNLRPYSDADWLAQGGLTSGGIGIALFPLTLPHMPIADEALWDKSIHPAPPLDILLSRKRFFFKCQSAKSRAKATLSHPLLLELTEITRAQAAEKSKSIARKWIRFGDSDSGPCSDGTRSEKWLGDAEVGVGVGMPPSSSSSVAVPPPPPPLISNNCSTLGSVPPYDATFRQSCTNNGEGTPQLTVPLRISRHRILQRSRHQHLYVFTQTCDGELHVYLASDTRAYDEEIIREWFQYFGDAMVHYLAGRDDAEHA